MSSIEPVAWKDGVLRILDQTRLPAEERYIEARDAAAVADAIRRLAVRGAPLIGIAAAYALALVAQDGADLRAAAETLASTRPTAVNLRWALDRVLRNAPDGHPAAVLAEARRIHDEQIEADLRIGAFGSSLLRDGDVLTHCNTGALATGGIGTALGVIRSAHAAGVRLRVLVDETRPLLQGARLTAWELQRDRIPHAIIADGAAAGIIAGGSVRTVVVGADRIAANGDVANKTGTYGLALAASAHHVPFYVCAPLSTIDTATATGRDIAIEHRAEGEVLHAAGVRTAPDGSAALNPAFDVTPASLITALITERGVLRPPYARTIADAHAAPAAAR